MARTSGGEQRRWISGTMGNLMSRAFKMSNDVYAAMLARGFSGEMRALTLYRMRAADWAPGRRAGVQRRGRSSSGGRCQ